MPLRAFVYILSIFLLMCILPIIGASCAGTGGGGQPADSAAQQQGGQGGGQGGGASPAPNVGSPQSISLKSDKTQVNVRDVGGDSVASITATVVDGLGRAVPGSNVIFTISGAASGGGATIESPKVADSNGDASTKFTAGTVSGTLIITAQVSGTSVQAAYSQLTVNAGPPNVISLSRSPMNIDGGDGINNIDNVESTVSAIVPDKYGNPVKNGTPIYFSTDYCIVEAMCTTTNGACSVKFRSSEIRPPRTSSFATITATTSGQSGQISDTTPILLAGAGATVTVTPSSMPPGNPPQLTIASGNTHKFQMYIRDANGNGLSKDTTVSLLTVEGATDSPKVSFDSYALNAPTFIMVTYSPPGKSGNFPADITGVQTVTKNGNASQIFFPQAVNVTVP